MRSKPTRDWMTPPEAAAMFGIRAEAIRRYIRANELPAVNFARQGARRPRLRIHREALDAFLRRRAVAAPPRTAKRRSDENVINYIP